MMNIAVSRLPVATIDLPDFSQLGVDELRQNVHHALAQAQQQIAAFPEQLSDAQQALTLIFELDHAENQLQQDWGVISHLNAVNNTAEIRQVYQDILPISFEYMEHIA